MSASAVSAPGPAGVSLPGAGLTIGVLALQGDFAAHGRRLRELGASVREVRRAAELAGLDGLVAPGGESTAMLELLARDGLFDAVATFAHKHPFFGTCAGAILAASRVEDPSQPSFGVIDMDVARNAYGRQAQSFVGRASGAELGEIEAVFIRAPRIRRTGPGVEVVASRNGEPVLVRQGRACAATFHPELSADPSVHRWFLRTTVVR